MTAPDQTGGTRRDPARSHAPTSSTWSRLVAFKFLLLFGAHFYWSGFLVFVTRYHWSSGPTAGPGSAAAVPTTMFQEEPGIARTLLTLAAIAILIETASILWRVARHSARPGMTGMIVASLGGVVALLGFMTVGMFVAPFAGICVILALPIGRPPSVDGGRADVPAGWYGDPSGRSQWRFWDGRMWTVFIAGNDQAGVGSLGR